MNLSSLTLKEYIDGVKSGVINPEEVINEYISHSENSDLNAYITLTPEYARTSIEAMKDKPLAAAPIAVKDLILTKGITTTCGSAMLENYVAPYSATCIENLEKNGGVIIGKTNLDEFAMGSSNETSYFGNVKNPHSPSRIPGGSSGGSAAVVAGDLAIASLGTDTGGSIRLPASLCGIVGIKPTYGTVSRYGVQSMASSLDQVGTFSKTVEDGVILLDAISGYDTRDAVMLETINKKSWFDALETSSLSGFKIALPTQFFGEGLDPKVKEKIYEAVECAKSLGATVDEIDFPLLPYSLSVYYIIVPAEVSTNLARHDGIKYGRSLDTFSYDSIYEYYTAAREGFGDEAKRRILIGSFVLSAGYYDAYYAKATKVRQKIIQGFSGVFQDYDVVLGPVCPTVAWKLGEKTSDPLQMYLSDIYTIPVNLAGLPAMSLPVGSVEDQGENMPVGLHIIAGQQQEAKMFAFANLLEKKLKGTKK